MKRKLSPELDFASEHFNPAKVLKSIYCKFDLPLPFPKAKTYDNIADWFSHTFGKNTSVSQDESRAATKNDVYVLRRNFKYLYETSGFYFNEKRFDEKTEYMKSFKRKRTIYGKFKPVNLKIVDPDEPMRSSKIIIKRPDGSRHGFIDLNTKTAIASDDKAEKSVNDSEIVGYLNSASRNVSCNATQFSTNNGTSKFVYYNEQKQPSHYFSSSENMKEFLLKYLANCMKCISKQTVHQCNFEETIDKIFSEASANSKLNDNDKTEVQIHVNNSSVNDGEILEANENPVEVKVPSVEKSEIIGIVENSKDTRILEIRKTGTKSNFINHSNFKIKGSPSTISDENVTIQTQNYDKKSTAKSISEEKPGFSKTDRKRNIVKQSTSLMTLYNSIHTPNSSNEKHDKHLQNKSLNKDKKYLDVKRNSDEKTVLEENNHVKRAGGSNSISFKPKVSECFISNKTAEIKTNKCDEKLIAKNVSKEKKSLESNSKKKRVEMSGNLSSENISLYKPDSSCKNDDVTIQNKSVDYRKKYKAKENSKENNTLKNSERRNIKVKKCSNSSSKTNDLLCVAFNEKSLTEGCDLKPAANNISSEKSALFESDNKSKKLVTSSTSNSTCNPLYEANLSSNNSDKSVNVNKKHINEKSNSKGKSVLKEIPGKISNVNKVEIFNANGNYNSCLKINYSTCFPPGKIVGTETNRSQELSIKNISKENNRRKKITDKLNSSISKLNHKHNSTNKYEKEDRIFYADDKKSKTRKSKLKEKDALKDSPENRRVVKIANISVNSHIKSKTLNDNKQDESNSLCERPNKKLSIKASINLEILKDISKKREGSKEIEASNASPSSNFLTENANEIEEEIIVCDSDDETKYSLIGNKPTDVKAVSALKGTSKFEPSVNKNMYTVEHISQNKNIVESEPLSIALPETNFQNKKNKEKTETFVISDNLSCYEENSTLKQNVDVQNSTVCKTNEGTSEVSATSASLVQSNIVLNQEEEVISFENKEPTHKKIFTASTCSTENISCKERDDTIFKNNGSSNIIANESNEQQGKFDRKCLFEEKSTHEMFYKNKDNLKNPNIDSNSKSKRNETLCCENIKSKVFNYQEKIYDINSKSHENDVFKNNYEERKLSFDKKDNPKKGKTSSLKSPSLEFNSKFKIRFGEIHKNEEHHEVLEIPVRPKSSFKPIDNCDINNIESALNKIKEYNENTPVSSGKSDSESTSKEVVVVFDSAVNENTKKLSDLSTILTSVENTNCAIINKRNICLKECSEISAKQLSNPNISSDSDDISKEVSLLDVARKARNKIRKVK